MGFRTMKPSYVVRLLLDKYDYVPREKIESRLEGSSFVNLDKRYLYFAIGKSGCTTMKTLLHRIEGAPPIKIICDGWDESRRDMFIHARENVPLPSLLDLNDAMQREVIHSPDFLRMTVVRNPYTRVLSAWRKIMLCEPGAERQYLAIKGALPRGPKKELTCLIHVQGRDSLADVA
jgi:hypothetical protein